MVNALVLVKLSSSSFLKEVVGAARKAEGVSLAMPVFGRFDVAILVKAKDTHGIDEVLEKIRGTKGIKSTETLMET
jgi:2-isopropylmalate synthase